MIHRLCNLGEGKKRYSSISNRPLNSSIGSSLTVVFLKKNTHYNKHYITLIGINFAVKK